MDQTSPQWIGESAARTFSGLNGGEIRKAALAGKVRTCTSDDGRTLYARPDVVALRRPRRVDQV
jgi:hypothetical protein